MEEIFAKEISGKVDIPVSYTKRTGEEVNATRTQYNVVLAGKVSKVITGKKLKDGRDVVTVKIQGGTQIDPTFQIPVTQEDVYIDFTNNKYGNDADKARLMNPKPGALVIIKGTKSVETESDGTERAVYYGKQMFYFGSRIIEFRKDINCFVVSGPVAVKDDGTLSIPGRGYDPSKKGTDDENYTYWISLSPKTEMSDDEKEKFAKVTGDDGELHCPKAAFVIPAEDWKIDDDARGIHLSASGEYTSYTLVS